MIRSRINYWSCSKFADWIRGTSKPYALECGEWAGWRKEAKNKHPYRYWLAETGLKKLQNFFMFPSDLYHSIKVYINNRFIDKTHYLKTGLKPGNFYEFDHRIIHGLFNELVDFVEIELALMSKWAGSKDKKYFFKNGRCEKAGLDYLDWAGNLRYNEDYLGKKCPKYGELTPQAKSALKIRELYVWWKHIRPNRPNPMEASGYSDLEYDDDEEMLFKKRSKKHTDCLRKLEKMEKDYDKEDTQMMIDLIKIRKDLWA